MVNCIVCQRLTGLFSDDFCELCLLGMGYVSERDIAALTDRARWDLFQILLRPDAPRPFPGDTPPARPHTGPKGANLFERVKSVVDLGKFAGQFTELTTAGPGKLKGCCPLHQEKTPSFYIFSGSQTWRCFGACVAGGDVIALAQERFKLPTPKAAALHLANEFGIPHATRRKGHRPRLISIEVSG